jgi:cell shape-determining protein MreC
MKTVDIITWVLNAFLLWSLIYGIILRKKTKKIIKTIQENSKKNYDQFVIEQREAYNKFLAQYSERQNVLSKENNKLRTENEEMKERLTNLGLK